MAKKINEATPVEAEFVEEVPGNGSQMTRYEQPVRELALTPVFDLAEAKQRMAELQAFVHEYLIAEEDYGTIPGTKKPTLFKSGADKLCDIYGLADEYQVTGKTEDWSQNLFDYEVKCTLLSKRTGRLVGTGLGSCSSFESKYRYREAKRKCPRCGKETIIRGKEEYGGGWLCFKKLDGCGTNFNINDPAIIGQTVGRVQNEDIADQKNTILKMAKKRAKIDAVLSVTRSSGLFTQDVEDWVKTEEHEERVEQTRAAAPAKTAAPKPAPKAAPAKPTAPPKATIPVDKPTQPSVPRETAKQPGIIVPTPSPVKDVALKSRTERGRDIANKTGCSTTNLTSFIGRVLGAPTPEDFKKVPVKRFEAVIWSLEETMNKFPKGFGLIKQLICDEANVDPSVKSYFYMAFSKAEA